MKYIWNRFKEPSSYWGFGGAGVLAITALAVPDGWWKTALFFGAVAVGVASFFYHKEVEKKG